MDSIALPNSTKGGFFSESEIEKRISLSEKRHLYPCVLPRKSSQNSVNFSSI